MLSIHKPQQGHEDNTGRPTPTNEKLSAPSYDSRMSGTADQPHDPVLARDILASWMNVLALPDGHEIGDHANACGGVECRLEDIGPFEVSAGRGVQLAGLNGAIAAFGVIEQAQEDGRAIEVRQAGPIDRPLGADEGHCLGIADNHIIADRSIPLSPPRLLAAGHPERPHQLARPLVQDL
jgi:hypothetical protein